MTTPIVLLSAFPIREFAEIDNYIIIEKWKGITLKDVLEDEIEKINLFKKENKIKLILVIRHPTTKETVSRFLEEFQKEHKDIKLEIEEKDTITSEELKELKKQWALILILVPKKEFGIYNRQEFQVKSINDLEIIRVFTLEEL